MPHYQDGTPARVGDVVRGKGYNVRGPDGQLREIIATVLQVTPGSDHCNVQLAYLDVVELAADVRLPQCEHFEPKGLLHSDYHTDPKAPRHRLVRARLEYGEAGHFTLVHRSGDAPPAACRKGHEGA